MRNLLEERYNTTGRYRAAVGRWGERRSDGAKTILLTYVTTDPVSTILADHIWAVVGSALDHLPIRIGTWVSFTARVDHYYHGTTHWVGEDEGLDYRLTDIRDVRII